MGDFNDALMSSINGKREKKEGRIQVSIQVKAETLENILDNELSDSNKTIDLLSLDTEGYEFEILNGLNLKKYSPKYLLIEIYKDQYDKIVKLLFSNGYKLHSNFTNYNKNDNPGWDKNHQDYLFIFN